MREYAALKGFAAPEGEDGYVKRGSGVLLSEARARELRRSGLIGDMGEKLAPLPQNKMTPEPKNKAAKPSGSK
ncbi:hypothetical protein SAMN05216548_10411 [Faunimonas pinastri]|uniref:Uncharacterized protein n=1 Tax=Faunimonas pinastri TaxID=1855383 RepID=A0A1H9F5K8_9HYPH|nr:hypothetical protein [Faunimonas pinastri]SEQ33266.1 hypothetical protein SAMN05216548_10411 [Faunimonas pinastri]